MPELIDSSDIPDMPTLSIPFHTNYHFEQQPKTLLKKEIKTEIPKKEYKPFDPKTLRAAYVSEYIDDTGKLLVKTNISNILTLIDECDDSTTVRQMTSMLKNMIILHGKQLQTMPQFVKNIEGSLTDHELRYDVFVIYKMLHNITNRMIHDNIHFRSVNENIQKYPPLSTESRIILEKKVKYMRYSYQAKKKRTPFEIGQIVGAKDKEMKWWLSRILHVHNEPNRSGYWYYIRFEGWGPIHDEWIYSETYRVRWFNARKHFLKK